MTSISSERAKWYTKRFGDALATVEHAIQSLTEAKEEQAPKLVFREMQHTKMVDTVPPPRVQGLKHLQSLILQDRLEQGRWQLDPLGRLLLGQEHYYRGA